MGDLDPRTVTLRTLPLQTGRRGFVLNALFVQNNFRHAVKDKGVSNDTMEDRRQYIYRAFHYLEHNDIKSFKLDPRSFGDRHVRFLFADMERRAKAGQLGPSATRAHPCGCTIRGPAASAARCTGRGSRRRTASTRQSSGSRRCGS